MNEFYQKFRLNFILDYFSKKELSNLLPSLSYSYKTLAGLNTPYAGEFTYLYDLEIILPEIKDKIERMHNILFDYFNKYIEKTDINKFTIKFYVEKSTEILEQRSLLYNAIPNGLKKSESWEILQELRGEFLVFEINNEVDLKRMISNIFYYMVKYECIAAINEGEVIDDNPDMKHALIASVFKIFTTDYLLTSRGLSQNIRNAGLSNEAIILYEIMFGVDISDIYDIQYNTFTNVFSEISLSPYLLYKNRKILRDLFTIYYGNGDPNYIESLRFI